MSITKVWFGVLVTGVAMVGVGINSGFTGAGAVMSAWSRTTTAT